MEGKERISLNFLNLNFGVEELLLFKSGGNGEDNFVNNLIILLKKGGDFG